MTKQRQRRCQRALERLENRVKKGDKSDKVLREIANIKKNLDGSKKKKQEQEESNKKGDRWFIDIFAIHLGYVKNSERRKNKGKSRKKLKKVKTVNFVKSIIAQPGAIQSYREGRMGLSPKTHTFRMRKEEI